MELTLTFSCNAIAETVAVFARTKKPRFFCQALSIGCVYDIIEEAECDEKMRRNGGIRMNHQDAISMLEQMLNGVHPLTGEVLEQGHICHEPQIMRALYKAISALRDAEGTKAGAADKPRRRAKEINKSNVWTQEEDEYLRNAHEMGTAVGEIARTLQRREKAVKCRLVFLGLASREILGNQQYAQTVHEHMGLPWYPEEDEKLADLFARGWDPPMISAEMKRSIGSVMSRLERLGLVEDRCVYAAPQDWVL